MVLAWVERRPVGGGLLALALPAGFALEGRRETSLTNPRRSKRWLFVSPTFFLGMVYC